MCPFASAPFCIFGFYRLKIYNTTYIGLTGPNAVEREVNLANSTRSDRGGTIRLRPDGRWEARYTIGFDPKTGNQRQKSIYGKTKTEVRKKLTKALAEIDEGSFIEPCSIRFGDWLDEWQETYLSNVKPSTAFLYQRRIELYIKPTLGKTRIDALDTRSIQRLYNELGKERDDKPGLAPKTIKSIHGIVHEALEKALALGYIKRNPSNGCVLPRIVKKDIQPLSDAQVTKFIDAIEDNSYKLLYHVYLFTGMRECELLGLMWNCVDFERGVILVNKQLNKSQRKGGQYEFTAPKNGKSRYITPAPYVMDLLKEQKEIQEKQKEAAGVAWEESGLVFTNALGRYVSYRALYDDFKKVVTRLGFPSARIHDLRHTYAVNSIRAGDDIKTVQENLGHATAAFTLDFYGHYTDDMRRASSAHMQEFISTIIKNDPPKQ